MNTTSTRALDQSDRAPDARPVGRVCTMRTSPQSEPPPPPRPIPTVRAFVTEEGFHRFWCIWCKVWHAHGRGAGHRVAHCFNERSPYIATGYILKPVGLWRNNKPVERPCCESCGTRHPTQGNRA
jgi:hypothetical protein